MNIKILVAAHKNYWMPEDSVYLPLHVGAEGKPDLDYTKGTRSKRADCF